jgi:hypothetical protein
MHGWSGKNCRATPTKIIRVVFITHQRPLVSLVLLYTPSEDFAAGTMSHCSLLMVACALMLVSSRAVGASPDFESRWVDSKREFDFDMITTSDGQHHRHHHHPTAHPTRAFTGAVQSHKETRATVGLRTSSSTFVHLLAPTSEHVHCVHHSLTWCALTLLAHPLIRPHHGP